MTFFSRAGGIAAAVLLTVFGTFHSSPSFAWQLDLPSQTEAAVQTPSAETPALVDPTPAAQAEPRAPAPSLDRAIFEADDAEGRCLATAVYFEAKGEPLAGQLGVAQVIINRAHSGRFPASLCGVVRQRGQFSFVRGGRLPCPPHGSAAWHKAVAVARIARDGGASAAMPRALFFHARGVAAGWRGVTRVAAIGNHIFYR
jgi:N-acetylmuramoyl-L-alanine amidase